VKGLFSELAEWESEHQHLFENLRKALPESAKREILFEILGVLPEKAPLALICLGKPTSPPSPVPRKEVKEKVTYTR